MAPKAVLVVDDDPDLRELIADALAEKGYRVEVAQDGKEALDRVSRELPGLILLDMRMPVMDGWTFAQVFHDRYGRSVPIVVVTAAQDSQLRADEIGADSHLGKPFDLDELYEIVEDTFVE